MTRLTIVSVAFPLARVGPDAVGGAEQVLSEIDRGLVRRGHRSIVIACSGSEVAGTLLSTLPIPSRVTLEGWYAAHNATRHALACAFDRFNVDLVHFHGVDFADYLPSKDIPVLATLHLPINWYDKNTLASRRPRTYVNCVSRSQRELLEHLHSDGIRFLPEIENGVHTDLLQAQRRVRKRDFVVSLGRICPEKGFHIALRAAKLAGTGMLLAGQVFPFEEHQRYFAEQIVPELDSSRRFIGPVAFNRKRRLLSCAKCLIVPSVVPETSSLVAREALACGTPVIAFRRGALPSIIDHGKTGYILDGKEELPDAIQACDSLDPQACQEVARLCFSSDKMVEKYIVGYHQILTRPCGTLSA